MALKFPAIYLLKTHFEKDPQELRRLEKDIDPVWDTKEAKIFLSKITSRKRASFELRKIGLDTEDVSIENEQNMENVEFETQSSPRPRKRRKVDSVPVGKELISLDSSSQTDSDHDANDHPAKSKDNSLTVHIEDKHSASGEVRFLGTQDHVSVLHISWYTDSLEAGELLPYEKYLVYQGKIVDGPKNRTGQKVALPPKGSEILARANNDGSPPAARRRTFGRHTPRLSGGYQYSQPASLPQETTEEYDVDMPPVPEFLNTVYCCQRPTPLHCPNEAFLAQLRIIKQARALEHKMNSLRAYSGGIATVASYPYSLMSARELHRLPNCGDKITALWREWHETGHIAEVDNIESDDRMRSLNIFYGIHDVSDANAKKFYDKGWRDLDDVVEYGWGSLTRNQQIGVKYYDDFQLRISRMEVQSIANVVLEHANRLRDGFQMVICGGFRRGKPDCGDVDVVLSHPDEEATVQFLQTLLESLEEDSYITHRLTVSTRNSDRGQSPVSWKGGNAKAGSGFDTLDHAFVVWQNPEWPTKANDLRKNSDFKNPNHHRRVDIIVTPWKTAGCAIIGWSGGTMFERDLRLYCKEKLNLKFDSSGVRRRNDGSWVDLEAGDGDLLVKEKRVFSGLGLEWREPTERCTD